MPREIHADVSAGTSLVECLRDVDVLPDAFNISTLLIKPNIAARYFLFSFLANALRGELKRLKLGQAIYIWWQTSRDQYQIAYE